MNVSFIGRKVNLTLFCLLWVFLALSSMAMDTKVDAQMETFKELLNSYRIFKQYKPPESLKLDRKLALLLPLADNKLLDARYNEFNQIFLRNKKKYLSMKNSIKAFRKKYSSMNASQKLQYKNMTQLIEVQQKVLFDLSVQANLSAQELIEFIDPKKREAVILQSERPKMPGIFMGSKKERALEPMEDRKDLSPVDKQFYETQVGKKIQSDIGGEADYWSLDQNDKSIFVKKEDNPVFKVRIREQDSERIVQTRGGKNFQEPVGRDLPLDLSQTDVTGTFYKVGNPKGSLFGQQKKNTGPATLPPGHSADDGHDHNHP